MKKFLCSILLLVMFASPLSSALEKQLLTLGILTKLNTTEEEFAEVWKKTFAPNNEILEIRIKFYDSLTSMQMALNAQEINQMFLPEAAARYVMNLNSEYESTLSLRAKNPYGLAFGFREESKNLRDKFNEALNTLRENWKLSALEGIYIASPARGNLEPVRFEKFDGAETIKVAVTGDLPPIDFIEADGTPAGFNTAVLAEVGNILQINIELVNVEAGARTAALASGRVDAVFWYEINNNESEKQSDIPEGVILSTPYYEWNNFLHVKKSWTTDSSTNWNIKKSFWEMLFNDL